MSIIYVVIALLLLVAIIYSVLRRRGSGKRSSSVAAGRSRPPAVASAPADTGDPNATQVYRRTPRQSADSAPRQGPAPTALAGARLVALSGSRKGQSFALAAAGLTVGRDSSCDIVLGDARVSTRHAWIGIVDGRVTLRDLDSTNGTFLNAQTHASVRETELRANDTIFFGGHQGDQFRFLAE
jgi:hypothetical protein